MRFLLALVLFSFSLRAQAAEDRVPLLFDSQYEGLNAVGPSLVWSLTKANSFTVGGETFLNADYSVDLSSLTSGSFTALFKFNARLFPKSDLYLYDGHGKIISDEKIPFGQSQISKTYSKKDLGFKGNGYKLCVYSEDENHQSLVCSPTFNDKLVMSAQETKMVINGQNQSLQGSMSFAEQKPVELTWVSEGGFSFHHVGKTPKTVFYEVSKLDENTLLTKTSGTTPIGNTKIVPQQSFADLRVFSETQVPLKAAVLAVREPGGLIYTYEIRAEKIPEETSRIYLQSLSPHSTYGSAITLRGKKWRDTEVSSRELGTQSKYDDETFSWDYAVPEMFEYNHSKMLADSQVFTYEMMRMPRTYLFAGIGVSLGSDNNVATFYHLHGTHWLNEPFGESYSGSRARWGLTAGYESTLSTSVSTDQLKVDYLDLMYRLHPGVESWDEGLALTWGASQLIYSTSRTVNLFGPGIFWTRSLPEWFNSILGFSDFFRRPKWVDVSANYYLLSPDNTLTGSSLQIRALGRIDITHYSYFEAGWGILIASYTDNRIPQMVSLNSAHGYLGFGYRF